LSTTLHPAGAWSFRKILLASDLLSLSLTFYLAYRLLPLVRPYLRPGPFELGPFSVHAWLLLIILPLWYLLLAHAGMYSPGRPVWSVQLMRLLRASTFGLAGVAALIFAFKLQEVSRLLMFSFCALSIPLVPLGRAIVLSLWEAHRSHAYNIARVLVIGSRERARDFIRQARSDVQGCFQVIGCMDPELNEPTGRVEGVPILGSTDRLREYLFSSPVDVVVFAMPLERLPQASSLLDATLELGLRVAILPDLYVHRMAFDLTNCQASFDLSFRYPMLMLSSVSRSPSYLVLKRTIDVLLSAFLLILLAPLFFLLGVLVKLTPPGGPVFYRWHVLGVNKKPFVSFKFRTMVPDAHLLRPHFLARNEMSGPVFKLRDDPRITRLGRFLRKYSLDELPQLYSVLKGDMSLVGPRPPFQEEADRYEFWQRRKLCIKPGITCLWQINGRSEIHSFDEWARLDLDYIQNASLWLDCKILWKTIPAVFRGRGAY